MQKPVKFCNAHAWSKEFVRLLYLLLKLNEIYLRNKNILLGRNK